MSWFSSLRAELQARIDARLEPLLSDVDWQAKASLHPLSSFMARRRARSLFDLCAGFTYSQTLVALERLGLIDELRGSPASLEALAKTTDTAPDALRQLLQAGCALDVLRLHRGRYRLGAMGAALAGNPGVRAMIAHHRYLYADLARPERLLAAEPVEGELKRYWAYAGSAAGDVSGQDVTAYSELMAQSQRFIVDQVLAAHDFSGYTRVLDLGGGRGAFIAALAERYPHLRFELFDLPHVIEEAKAHLDQKGIADRVTFTPGDLFNDPPPTGADLVTLVRVLHDHDDKPVAGLLPRVRGSMANGAALMVAEPMAGPAAGGVEAYFASYFLAMGQGRLRTYSELAQMARNAGFADISTKAPPVPMLVELMLAKKV